jgi:hypothetical protein
MADTNAVGQPIAMRDRADGVNEGSGLRQAGIFDCRFRRAGEDVMLRLDGQQFAKAVARGVV